MGFFQKVQGGGTRNGAKEKSLKEMGKIMLGMGTQNANYARTARRPDLTLEDEETERLYVIDMACPSEANKTDKRAGMIRKKQQLCFEVGERRPQYMAKLVSTAI